MHAVREGVILEYEQKLRHLWEEHADTIELLMLARLGGREAEERELRAQLDEITTAVQLNARMLGAEECKVWLMQADPRRQAAAEADANAGVGRPQT